MNGGSAKPTSRNKLRALAKRIRKIGEQETGCFDIVKFLEAIVPGLEWGFDVEIIDDDVLAPGCEALSFPDRKKMYVPERTYIAAVEDDPRARFTLCHELGHMLLHRDIGFARNPNEDIPIYKQPEWQANTFAAELLAPADLIGGVDIDEISTTYKVSSTCAEIQKRYSK